MTQRDQHRSLYLPRTWPSPTSSSSPSSAAGATAKPASGCARSTTTAKTASAPTSNRVGWHCFSPASTETRVVDTWRNLRHELDRMHLVTLATADGRVAQRSALTSRHKGTVNLSNPRATFAGSPPRFTRSRVMCEAYVVSRTSHTTSS